MTDFMLMFKGRDEPPQSDMRSDLCELVERHLPEAEEDSDVWRFPHRNSENHRADWRDLTGRVAVSFMSFVYRRERWGMVVSYGAETDPRVLPVMQGLLKLYKPTALKEAPRWLQLYYARLEGWQQPLSERFYSEVLDALMTPFSRKPIA